MQRSKTPSPANSFDPVAFAHNMAQATELSQRVLQHFLGHTPQESSPSLTFDPANIGGAYARMWSQMLANPVQAADSQLHLWQDYLKLWQNTAQRALGEQAEPIAVADAKDRRFRDEAWQDNPLFDYFKQFYLLTGQWMQRTVRDVEGLDSKTAQKLDFYTRQFVDAMSPTNFLMTNPEVLRATFESNGENLVKGLSNLLEDLERGRISMTDPKAFAVGKNLAITPGKVVYQNELMQLIQYNPTTKQVYKTPLLVIPAWINKFYILDLQPDNSLVKWLVAQGHTVFMVSWVNPDEKLGQKRFDDYLTQGTLAALDAIEDLTGEKQANVMGYCLGGTLLAITLAYLKKNKQAKRIKSATYLTTLVDFTEAGELSVFVDEEQLQALEKRMSQTGYLEGRDMATTFNMLRANDLIWSFVINNYLLGKDPFPFDLLYWNSDSTRMPAVMHSFYLRNMYQKNLLAKPGAIVLDQTPIDLTSIDTPSYLMSTREDHIAPWHSTYAATKLYQGPIRFVLAASGHVAGVVNPPGRKKYSHWVNTKLPDTPEQWLEKAKEVAGSWWPDWAEWVKPHAGKKVAARQVGKGIEPAPGSYVKSQS